MNETQLNQPFVLNITLNIPSFENPWQNLSGGNLYPFKPPTTPEARQAFPFVLQAIDRFFNPEWVTQYNQQWNFTIQRQIPWDIVVTAGYVGSKGTHLVLNREINPGIFVPGASTSGNVDSRCSNRVYQGINEASTSGKSNFHSLQLSANRRFSKGITILTNYKWSKAIDYQSLDRNVNLPQDSTNLRSDYGPADFDRRHNFVTSFLADIPSSRTRSPSSWFTHGWRQWNLPVHRRQPRASRRPIPQRAVVGFLECVGLRRRRSRRFSERRAKRSLRARTIQSGYVALQDDQDQRERAEFRWELFNALNHSNPGDPIASLSSSSFGKIISATPPRIMQVGMKILF